MKDTQGFSGTLFVFRNLWEPPSYVLVLYWYIRRRTVIRRGV